MGICKAEEARKVDVSLVCMPFAEVQRPSIALGLLHASLAPTSLRSEVVYANFGFAETLGLVAYQAIQSTPTDHLLGEWCFSGELFPPDQQRENEFLDLVLDIRSRGFSSDIAARKQLMWWIRSQVPGYLDDLAQEILSHTPRIVGCSSVFQQHCASLALLRRIHDLNPSTLLVMGGANCEGEMGIETLRSFPWVDCVVSGEADDMFAELCTVLLDYGRDIRPDRIPLGAVCQAQIRSPLFVVAQHPTPPRRVVHDMDALPTPDYDHYFETLRHSSLSELIQPGLLAESSRGCWWGEKAHCTFCGLNGTGMKYRSKSAGRVISELKELSTRYDIHGFQFVDNILDMSFFRTVLPQLAAQDERYSLFYEVKSNLRREQVQLLSDAGVRWIQPGIESLHDGILNLIAKGNSCVMNVQLLKWCLEFDIHTAWNMLSGVPGDSDIWYAEMADWMPALFHLQPPSGVSRVRFDRFSPYHMRPAEYGLKLRPSRAYEYVYRLPTESLMRLAYSFEDSDRPGHVHRAMQEGPGQQKLRTVVEHWNHLWQTSRPVLQVSDDDDRLYFTDTRPQALQTKWFLDGLGADIYRKSDPAQTVPGLVKQLSAEYGRSVHMEEIQSAVEVLCAAGVLLNTGGKVFALAIDAQRSLGSRTRELQGYGTGELRSTAAFC